MPVPAADGEIAARGVVQSGMADDGAAAAGNTALSAISSAAICLPGGSGKNCISFDPAQVRLKRGRIWLPGLGWVRMDGIAPPARGARLVMVEVCPDGDGWMVHYEFEAGR